MKKIILCAMFLMSAAIGMNARAQWGIRINVNIGSQPAWGPTGYNYVDYYYLPDIETYYYVPTQQFIYLSNGRWIFSYSLPLSYRNYDLYSGYKVVLNRPNAYLNFNRDREEYGRYRGFRSRQEVIKTYDRRQEVITSNRSEKEKDRKDHDKDRREKEHDKNRRDRD